MKKNSFLIRCSLAVTVLTVGGLIYLLQRPADSTHLGRAATALFGSLPVFPPSINGFSKIFPDFAHPFAFALFTMLIVPEAGRIARLGICAFWLGMNLFFEVGQLFDQQFSQAVHWLVPDGSLSTVLTGYFINGTYDHFDILAMGSGVLSAFIVSELTQTGGLNDANTVSKGKYRETPLESGC